MKALILGAGPSGISLAWFLIKKNWEVDIIDMKDKVGGLARSTEKIIKGKKIDLDSGPHIFHTSDEEIIKIWQDNFEDFFNPRELFAANCKGEDFKDFHDYPISKEGLLKKGFQLKNIIKNNTNHFLFNNYRDYMKSRVGDLIEKEYFRNYPQKLWGISTEKMRADWAPKRIEIRDQILPFFHGQWCATSLSGSGSIYKKISEEIIESGGKIHLNTQITDLDNFNNRIFNVITKNKTFKIDNETIVISSIPSIQLGRLLGFKFKPSYRGVIIFSAIHKFDSFPDKYSWIYFDDPEISFTRVTNFTDLSPTATKDLSIFMYEVPFDSNVDVDEEEQIKKLKDSISKIPWLKSSFDRVINIQKEKYVYPIREMNYEKSISKINSKSDLLENLFRCGTAAEFEYGDVQICFRKSLDLANDLTRKYSHKNTIKTFFSGTKNNSLVFEDKSFEKIRFIAEIGLNHNGSVDLAKKLIDVSKEANADLVKLQLYNSETRANQYTRDAFYQEESDGEGENLYQIFKRCELSLEDMKNLYSYSEKAGIKLFFSAFDRDTVRKAYGICPHLFKISSMDLSNFEVCDEASKLYKKIIMSTGMSTLNDISKSSNFINGRIGKENLTLLHCISSYPMDISSISLGTIKELNNFSGQVGYSDHSMDSTTSLLAAAFGAKIIEKHITLDKELPGPDHLHSLIPEELNTLVDNLHNFNLITRKREGIIGSENKEYRRQKKGYYYKKDLKQNSIIYFDDLLLMPPCLGDDTFEVSKLIGKRLKIDRNRFDPVRKNDF